MLYPPEEQIQLHTLAGKVTVPSLWKPHPQGREQMPEELQPLQPAGRNCNHSKLHTVGQQRNMSG